MLNIEVDRIHERLLLLFFYFFDEAVVADYKTQCILGPSPRRRPAEIVGPPREARYNHGRKGRSERTSARTRHHEPNRRRTRWRSTKDLSLCRVRERTRDRCPSVMAVGRISNLFKSLLYAGKRLNEGYAIYMNFALSCKTQPQTLSRTQLIGNFNTLMHCL